MACNESGGGRSVERSTVALIIPALNESESLAVLLPMLQPLGLGQVLVCDNGSTDDTRRVVESHTATWVHEPRRAFL